MAAGVDAYAFGQVESYPACFSGQGLDGHMSGAVLGGEVEICETDEACATLDNPNHGNTAGPAALWEAVQLKVEPYSEEGEERGELMQMKECLVESMTDWRGRVQTEENHGHGTDQPPCKEGRVSQP